MNNLEADQEAPAWEIDNEYPGFESTKFKNDITKLNEVIDNLNRLGKELEPLLSDKGYSDSESLEIITAAQSMQELSRQANTLHSDLSAYTSCFLAVEGSHTEAKKINSNLQELGANLEESLVPLKYFIATANDKEINRFLENPVAQECSFQIQKLREHTFQRMLPPGEEKLLASLSPLGQHAWWNQYEGISSSTRINISFEGKEKRIGLSQISEYLTSSDRAVRITAWEAVNTAWQNQIESAASGINALAGWRIKEDSLRSKHRPKHFLDDALYSSRVEVKTIDVMMSVIRKNKHIAQKALLLMAACLGGKTYEPWDRFAPLPAHLKISEDRKISYHMALADLKAAFGKFHPDLADFVTLCEKKKWIEARSLPTKRPGAFSHGFTGSGEPRTFLSWNGTIDDARTFAHETGHSHHTYVLKDLPPEQRNYPMTLAETASNWIKSYKAPGCKY